MHAEGTHWQPTPVLLNQNTSMLTTSDCGQNKDKWIGREWGHKPSASWGRFMAPCRVPQRSAGLKAAHSREQLTAPATATLAMSPPE